MRSFSVVPLLPRSLSLHDVAVAREVLVLRPGEKEIDGRGYATRESIFADPDRRMGQGEDMRGG